MRCSKCGTLIEGSNGRCPLCGAPTAAQVPVYPSHNTRVRQYVVPFTVIYWLITALSVLLTGVLCYLYADGRHYWAIVLVSLLWLYFILRHTVLGIENFHYKILINTVMGLLSFVVIGFVLGLEQILIGWVAPIFYSAAWIANGVLALVSRQKARLHILNLWWQSLLAVAIFILCFSLHLYWIPSVVCGSAGIVFGLVITMTHPREVWSQIKRTLDM